MGGGRVGLSLANLLIDDGEDIALIENDEALCADVAAELDALVICGNGTNSKLLEEVNIEDADYFIATTEVTKQTFYHAYWLENMTFPTSLPV